MAGTVSSEERAAQAEPRASERRPAIVAVDDEPVVLAAVARDLRRGFGERYRVMRAGSGAEALEILTQLRTRGDQVALLLADQRMPVMAGTDFLVQARTIVPDAKRVLLTAYADTSAAIAAINEVSLDYYLLKPWDPPEERLFPVLEDLLTTWESGAALESGGLRIIGHRFSKDSHDLRDFVARNGIPARWLDVERDGEARELLQVIGVDDARLPVALLEDGSVLERPTVLELAERLGVTAQPAQSHYDLVIVGGGPAGLAAAVYGASEGLRTVLVERDAPGGQAGQSSRIENYLGFPTGLSGSDLARRATDQARRLGAELLSVQDAIGLRVEGAGRMIDLTGGGTLSANCVLIASGVAYRQLDVPGFAELTRRRGSTTAPRPTEARSCAQQQRRHHRRRELGRAGRRALQRLRLAGHDARARAVAGALDVALPDRAARGPAERRRAHRQLGGRSRGRGRAPAEPPRPRRATATSPTSRPTPASSSSAPRRAPTGSRASSRATSAASSSRGPMPRAPAGRSSAIRTCSRRPCPASSWPATCARARSSASRAPSARARWPSRSSTSTSSTHEPGRRGDARGAADDRPLRRPRRRPAERVAAGRPAAAGRAGRASSPSTASPRRACS